MSKQLRDSIESIRRQLGIEHAHVCSAVDHRDGGDRTLAYIVDPRYGSVLVGFALIGQRWVRCA